MGKENKKKKKNQSRKTATTQKCGYQCTVFPLWFGMCWIFAGFPFSNIYLFSWKGKSMIFFTYYSSLYVQHLEIWKWHTNMYIRNQVREKAARKSDIFPSDCKLWIVNSEQKKKHTNTERILGKNNFWAQSFILVCHLVFVFIMHWMNEMF